MFFGHFDPERFILDNEINNCWDDLTDISAKKGSTDQPKRKRWCRVERETKLQIAGCG